MVPSGFYWLVSLLFLQVIVFVIVFRVRFISPIFYAVAVFVVIQFIFAPLSAILLGTNGRLLELAAYLPRAYVYVNVMFLSWAAGLWCACGRDRFQWKGEGGPGRSASEYALYVLLPIGAVLYVILWWYTGVGLMAAFREPYAARLQIIETAGAYHLRNLSLTIMWTACFLLYCCRNGVRQQALALPLGAAILVLSLPFGERGLLIFPLMAWGLMGYYEGQIRRRHLVAGGAALCLLVVVLGLYRELGRQQSATVSVLYRAVTSLSWSQQVGLLLGRFDSLSFYLLFLSRRNEVQVSVLQSVVAAVMRFLPAAWIGVKPLDMDGLLTSQLLRIEGPGIYGFTVLAEWYLHWGTAGYVIMPFISGFVFGNLIPLFSGAKQSVFRMTLFMRLVILQYSFIGINYANHVDTIFLLIQAAALQIGYSIYVTIGRKPRRETAIGAFIEGVAEGESING
jgi:hypothetical protein